MQNWILLTENTTQTSKTNHKSTYNCHSGYENTHKFSSPRFTFNMDL